MWRNSVTGVKLQQCLWLSWKQHSAVVYTWVGQGGRPDTLFLGGSHDEPRTDGDA